VVDGIFNDRLEGTGVVNESLFEAVLLIAKVQVAGMDEVHGGLIVVRVKNDYGGGVKVSEINLSESNRSSNYHFESFG